jgi:hypothetical protein
MLWFSFHFVCPKFLMQTKEILTMHTTIISVKTQPPILEKFTVSSIELYNMRIYHVDTGSICHRSNDSHSRHVDQL